MENEIRKIFKKSDLKNGMVVETRKGTKLLTFITTDESNYENLIFINNTMWIGDHYNEDLTRYEWKKDNFRDIVKVYIPKNNQKSLEGLLEETNLKLIWDREQKEKMTLAEIEAKLGYKIDLVESV